MIKIALKSLLMLICIFCTVLGVGTFDNTFPENNDNVARVKLAPGFDTLDYLFIGNSYTYSGINPLYFDSVGLRTYNLGVSTAGPYYYELLIDDYLSSVTRPPRTIVMVVSPITFTERADNWTLYPIHRYLNNPLSNMHIFMHYPVGTDIFNMMHKSFVKGAKNLVMEIPEETGAKTEEEILLFKGFNRTETAIKKRDDEEAVYRGFLYLEFNEDKRSKLIAIIEKYKKQHIDVVLHEMPSMNMEQYFNPEFMSRYNNTLSSISEGGTRIINNELALEKSMFRNIDHLNYHGANVFSAYLRGKLLEK